MKSPKFIDEALIYVKAGNGGRGCVSFRREKYVPKGGPDGGDGGDGGDVIIVGDRRLSSLLDFKYKRNYVAERGQHGKGSNWHGRNGKSVTIHVPVGTLIKDAVSGEIIEDIISDGQNILIAKRGRGGKGNAHFASSTFQTPKFAQPGEEGEERHLKLELKLLADVGIIGFPNAGKSTLISRISKAKPKIADYPFTTLKPNLGVVRVGDYADFVVADIPGLIEGAHSGKGLGVGFLKHIERTSIFIHMIDLSPDSGREPLNDFDIINNELYAFNPDLKNKKQVVVLNKVDITEARAGAANILNFFEAKGIKAFVISAVTGEGVEDLVRYVAEEVMKVKGILYTAI